MPAQRHPAASRGGDPVVAGIHVFLPPPYPPAQAGEGRVGVAPRPAGLNHQEYEQIMPAFAILEPPGYRHTGIEHADRFIFLPEKFSLAAFLFGPLWMIWRRLWV